jgi:epoxyqueuosine reductase QueG
MIIDVLKTHLVPSQEFIFGFADLRGLLNKKFNSYQFGISIGRRLNDSIVDKLENGPTIEYYNYYNRINSELADLSLRIQFDLQGIGIKSMAIAPTISVGSKRYKHYLDTLSFEISHKMVATRAGLGWIGKTDLLISNTFGPRLRLVTILLKKDPGFNIIPVEKSKCGKCDTCVVRCPANAANGKLWDIKTNRDEFFDAFKCREKCGELAKQRLNVDERICGLCVCVCPYGKKNKI